MVVKEIFEAYMVGDNVMTPDITGYSSRKFDDCTLLFELSEGRAFNGGLNYAVAVLILEDAQVQQIDLGQLFSTEEERNEHIDDISQEDIDNARRFGKILDLNKNEVISMDITKQKDNQVIRDDEYVDSELLRDNFTGSDEELRVIAKTVYECVDGTVPDEDFIDGCQSMVQYDYDYLKPYQEDIIFELIEELVCNDGEFKGE